MHDLHVVCGIVKFFRPEGFGYLRSPVGDVRIIKDDLGFSPAAGDEFVVVWRTYRRRNGMLGKKIALVLAYMSHTCEFIHEFVGTLTRGECGRLATRIVVGDFSFVLPLSDLASTQLGSLEKRIKTYTIRVRCCAAVENGEVRARDVEVISSKPTARSRIRRRTLTSRAVCEA